MAPIAPSKRRSLRAKLAAKENGPQPYAPRKLPRPDAAPVADAFISSKKDKRLVKHSSFVSRIEKANSSKSLKRRRPSKKLVTDLDSLKKALPDLTDDGDLEESVKQLGEGRMRLKSLRSRPGALKRKEKLVQSEVERFQGSLARLNAIGATTQGAGAEVRAEGSREARTETNAAGPQGQQHANATGGRWAALRGFISATMEQNPAFVKQKKMGEGE